MEYQKIIKLIDNMPDQPSKFRTKNWAKINDESKKSYDTGIDIKFKTAMLRSSLCGYDDAYILVKRIIKLLEKEIMMQQTTK